MAVAILIATTLVAWLLPASRVRFAASATVVEALGTDLPRPFAPSVAIRTDTVGGVTADLYIPHADAPPVLLVPGAVPEGRDDLRVRRLARTLARADRRVVVPELAVYGEQLVGEDVDRLVAMVLELSRDGHDVALVGISFGGSLALLAGADPRLDGRVAGVATFGAYADLLGVLQAATTGVSVVGDRTVGWEADPRAETVVREQLTALLPAADAAAVHAALRSGEAVASLRPAAAAVYRLLANDDPRRTYELAGDLPPAIRRRLEAVSPVSVADGLSGVPVVVLHAVDDPVIPYGEALRLVAAIDHAELFPLEGLQHADLRVTAPGGWLATADTLLTMWSFASRAIRWQEPTWPWQPG